MSSLIIFFFTFILGTIIGSFLNVCIYRLPRSQSVVFPPSHCTHCRKQLRPIELIPILSYLFLRGRCRHCGHPISWRYPLVELVTGIFFLVFVLKFWPSPVIILFHWIFFSLLIVIFFSDLENQLIADELSLSGIILGLAYNIVRGLFLAPKPTLDFFINALIGLILGYSLLYIIALAGKLIFRQEAMGEGDLLLAAFLGAFLGWQGLLLALFLAYLIAALAILPLLLFKKLKVGQRVAFGPALVAAALVVVFWGEMILRWYFSFL